MDFVDSLPTSSGNMVILSITDRFSAHFVALINYQLRLKLPNYLLLFSISWQSSRNSFRQKFTSQVCTSLGAKASSGFHPQTNSQTKRLVQELERDFHCVTTQNPATWSSQLPWVEYAHSSLISSATSLSPFEVSLGYQPSMFLEIEPDRVVLSIQHPTGTDTRSKPAKLLCRSPPKAPQDMKLDIILVLI